MLKKLKDILNTYTEEELEDMDIWIDCDTSIELIIIEEGNIVLITDKEKVKINDRQY